MTSLPDRIADAATPERGVTFVSTDGPDAEVTDWVSWADLRSEACGVAAGLAARGVGPGSHVALLAPTSRALVTAIEAIWLAGATVVVLPLPMRLASLDAFVEATVERIERADTALVVADRELAGFLPPHMSAPVALLDELSGDGTPYRQPSIDPSGLAILQFTSGSTSAPKGVMLPHHTVIANVDAAASTAGLVAHTDVFVSWLPLYHDMGLIGFLTIPMLTGSELVLGAPQDFMSRPARWMRWISEHRGTVTAAPNFAYALAARALRRERCLDLSTLRVALNGAEPVDRTTVDEFVAAGRPHGLDPGSIFPAFGMAELTIAGTFPEVGRGARWDVVDRAVLERERYARPTSPQAPHARSFAFLGRPVHGLDVRVTDPANGTPLVEREVGEVELRGTSVTPGYYRDPEATASTLRDGWLRTGDLGYLVDGELVLCGRIKDVIIIGGRNVFPDDIERAAASVDGVRAGNVVAFAVEGRHGKESVVVVAETKHSQTSDLHDRVVDEVTDAVGVPPREVVFVRPGTIPKTSSGKLQRSLCREHYLTRALEFV